MSGAHRRPLALPSQRPATLISPAQTGELHCNRTVYALKPHYHRIGAPLYSRWNTAMEKTAEQVASRLIPAKCESGDAR
jgi:hypothetical protein